jgi:hypothetical protein
MKPATKSCVVSVGCFVCATVQAAEGNEIQAAGLTVVGLILWVCDLFER